MNRGISTGASNWLIGTAAPTGPNGQWIIEDLKMVNLDPCIPRSIAKAAIEGYETYWVTRELISNPPDPTSPLLDETTTGGHRQLLERLATEFKDKGQTFTGRPVTSPDFSDIDSDTQVVIIDCQETNPDLGIYTDGERTDLIPPVVDGQLDLRETTMILEGGTWKVGDIQAETDVQCRTPPTPITLQVTGG